MGTLLLRVNPAKNKNLRDDEVVRELMAKLMELHPEVEGYQFERDDEGFINILMWGRIGK